LQNDLFILIGIIIGIVFALATTVIIVALNQWRPSKPTSLGNLRNIISKVQVDLQQAQGQIWDYGSKEEEKSQRWRIACISILGKVVSVLQSCWYGREQDSTSQAIYDELLVSLKSIGLVEIKPTPGQQVKEDDENYRIKKIEGKPPFAVSKLICPGYYFKSGQAKQSDNTDYLIEPALVEVKGINNSEEVISNSN
jgi:hypothetical protein